MEILINIFYILCFFVAIADYWLLYNSRKIFRILDFSYRYKKITGNYATEVEYLKYGKEYDPKLIEQNAAVIISIIALTIIGLLSNDWILFLSNISLYLLFRVVISILFKIDKFIFSNTHYLLVFLSHLSRILIFIFIVINHFHLKINTYDYFTGK